MAGVTQEQISITQPSVALLFEQAKVAQSTTGTLNVSMNLATTGTLNAKAYVMPYAGSIFAVSGRLSEVPTTGTITLYPVINGTQRADVSANCVNSLGTLSQSLRGTGDAARSNSRFAAGDTINLVYVGDSALAPNTQMDIVAQVWALLEEVRL